MKLKAFLAGKRGVCPDCGVSFQIPNVPDGTDATAIARTVATDTTPAPAARSENRQRSDGQEAIFEFDWKSLDPPVSRPAETAAARPASPSKDGPNWFLKIADGRQFGPAAAAVLERWIGEGRVAADSWVWREDWPQWRAASEVFTELGGASPRATADPEVSLRIPAKNLADRAGTSSRRRHLLIAGALAAVVLVLGLVLVVVLAR